MPLPFIMMLALLAVAAWPVINRPDPDIERFIRLAFASDKEAVAIDQLRQMFAEQTDSDRQHYYLSLLQDINPELAANMSKRPQLDLRRRTYVNSKDASRR